MSPTTSSSNGAYEASRVLKSAPGSLLSLVGYNSGPAQFIQLHDATSVPANTTAGVAEVFTVAFTGLTGADVAGDYLTAEDSKGAVAFVFAIAGTPVDVSAIPGRIVWVYVLAADVAAVLGSKFRSAADSLLDFTATLATATVTVTNVNTGARTNAAAGTSGTTVTTTVAGVTAIGIPICTFAVPTLSNFSLDYPAGLPFRNGIVVCNSTTGPTKTLGSADCYFTGTTA